MIKRNYIDNLKETIIARYSKIVIKGYPKTVMAISEWNNVRDKTSGIAKIDYEGKEIAMNSFNEPFDAQHEYMHYCNKSTKCILL